MDGVNTYNCQCPPEWTGMTDSNRKSRLNNTFFFLTYTASRNVDTYFWFNGFSFISFLFMTIYIVDYHILDDLE